jgi:hypothetical protein
MDISTRNEALTRDGFQIGPAGEVWLPLSAGMVIQINLPGDCWDDERIAEGLLSALRETARRVDEDKGIYRGQLADTPSVLTLPINITRKQ